MKVLVEFVNHITTNGWYTLIAGWVLAGLAYTVTMCLTTTRVTWMYHKKSQIVFLLALFILGPLAFPLIVLIPNAAIQRYTFQVRKRLDKI